MTLTVDHIIVCVEDLDSAASRFLKEHHLRSIEGGSHRGHGTANRIVPLGDAYIELVAVTSRAEADASPFGSWVGRNAASRGANALCLRSEDIESLAGLKEIEPLPMSRLRLDGVELSWRLAGLEETLSRGLPFFIEWDDMAQFPGASDLNDGYRLESVEVVGDRGELREWIGTVDRVNLTEGPRGVNFTIAET